MNNGHPHSDNPYDDPQLNLYIKRPIYRDTYTRKDNPIEITNNRDKANKCQPDYLKLRRILQKQYGRKVSMKETIETGKFLLNVYDNLLNARGQYDNI